GPALPRCPRTEVVPPPYSRSQPRRSILGPGPCCCVIFDRRRPLGFRRAAVAAQRSLLHSWLTSPHARSCPAVFPNLAVDKPLGWLPPRKNGESELPWVVEEGSRGVQTRCLSGLRHGGRGQRLLWSVSVACATVSC